MAKRLHGMGAILRRDQVMQQVGLSRSTIYQRMQEGTFPHQVRLGLRAVGWRATDIEEFLDDPAGYRAPFEFEGGDDE